MTNGEERKNPDPNVLHPIAAGYEKEIYIEERKHLWYINVKINRNLQRRTHMKYKGTLIVVKDCNRALKFYRDMFEFQLLKNNDGNMKLTDNLYLHESGYREQFLKRSVIPNNNQSELYFEEPDIEQFVERLETL